MRSGKRYSYREGDEIMAGGLLNYRLSPKDINETLEKVCPVVDPNIRLFVAGLIKMGFETTGSCAGHGYRGNVEVSGPVLTSEEADIRALGEALGLKDIRFKYNSGSEDTDITFKGMGGKRNWFGELDEAKVQEELGL